MNINSVRSGFQLQLGFATIPVDLFSVIPSNKGGGMKTLCKEHKVPIKQQYVCPTNDKPCETVKGFEQTKGKYVIPKAEDVEEFEREEGIELTAVPLTMIEEQTLPGTTMYYLRPAAEAMQGWEILFRLAKDKKRALIGQSAIRRNSRKMYRLLIFNDYLCLQALEFPEHIREAPDTPHVKVPKALMDQAKQVLTAIEVPWDKFDSKDQGLVRFRQMIETGEVVQTTDETGAVSDDNVVDLMAALKRSVEQTKAKTKTKAK